jgi:uncharacterized protein
MKVNVMAREKLFVDTAFAQAYINGRDQYHQVSLPLYNRMLQATQVITTEIILIEIANAFSASNRDRALEFIDNLRDNLPNVEVLNMDTELFETALELFRNRPDKTWGLADCVSFEVMRSRQISLVLTADQHFVQAGFRALMLENNKV